jgi:hypothetical protein
MSWFIRSALLALLLIVAACAKQTRDIRPAFVDPSNFADATCSQLLTERAKRSQALVFSGFAQDETSSQDRLRILGAPTPMGTIFEGDNEVEISRLKGELHALDAQMLIMNCGAGYG